MFLLKDFLPFISFALLTILHRDTEWMNCNQSRDDIEKFVKLLY